jgi:hypothetical protein
MGYEKQARKRQVDREYEEELELMDMVGICTSVQRRKIHEHNYPSFHR